MLRTMDFQPLVFWRGWNVKTPSFCSLTRNLLCVKMSQGHRHTAEEVRLLEIFKEIDGQNVSNFWNDLQNECDGWVVGVDCCATNFQDFAKLTSNLSSALHGFKKNSYSGIYVHQLFLALSTLTDEAQIISILQIVLGTDNEVYSLILELFECSSFISERLGYLLTRNHTVRELILRSRGSFRLVPEILERNSTLMCLQVEDQTQDDGIFGLISEALQKNQTLERLSLRSEKLGANELLTLVQGLQSNHSIRVFKIYGNACPGSVLAGVGELLQVNKVLDTCLLRFETVSMSTEEAECYLTGLGSSNLTQIDFSGMELGDPFLILENLPSKVKQLCLNGVALSSEFLNNLALHPQVENLETLEMDGCELDFEAIVLIANLAAMSKRLKYLSIVKNSLNSDSCKLLLESLKCSESLTYFAFGDESNSQEEFF
eukprot:TRINITY_DN6026_c0_g1_i1.p1 TRINITY_DN6026_c0_g1~~TRINITY_DN6026_c0_g1_i1.p1  ORF type:complete len:431 (-),score=75.93 TRINITY_DN6026_c0_g1_i1:547-1839(-)